MSSLFNSIGSGLSNTFNTVTGGIGSGISWFDNTGVGGFFTNALHSGSNLISGLANIPNELGNLVNGIANNSTLFFWGIILVAGVMLVNDFKGNSSSSYSSYRSYS